VSFANKNEEFVDNTPTNLLNIEAQPSQHHPPYPLPTSPVQEPPKQVNNLLDIDSQSEPPKEQIINNKGGNLLDIDNESTRTYQTTVNQSLGGTESTYATSIVSGKANQGS
jgi:hypothetical protein